TGLKPGGRHRHVGLGLMASDAATSVHAEIGEERVVEGHHGKVRDADRPRQPRLVANGEDPAVWLRLPARRARGGRDTDRGDDQTYDEAPAEISGEHLSCHDVPPVPSPRVATRLARFFER